MSAYEHILTEIEDGVGIVTMNRPEVLNAMNHKLGVELRDAVQAMAENDDVGCLVITGTGEKAFSAGGDIHEQRTNDRNLTPKELDDRNTISSRGSCSHRGGEATSRVLVRGEHSPARIKAAAAGNGGRQVGRG